MTSLARLHATVLTAFLALAIATTGHADINRHAPANAAQAITHDYGETCADSQCDETDRFPCCGNVLLGHCALLLFEPSSCTVNVHIDLSSAARPDGSILLTGTAPETEIPPPRL